MNQLNDDQKRRALEVMQEYLNAKDSSGKPVWRIEEELDKKRLEIIQTELGPLLVGYLGNTIPLSEFKTRIDSLNKRHEYWGFKGIKGQMFFNMILNVTEDEGETDQELKSALSVPSNEDIARSRLNTFISYIRRLGDAFVEAGGTKHARPKFSSAPFFLSYFWQIQSPKTWPAITPTASTP